MRALILAGGGMKVAYQAGCLQVLLDEAKIDFDYVDASSGGCLNAALWASGRTGTEIADVWRTTNLAAFDTLGVANWWRLLWAPSIGTPAGMLHVLRDVWCIDYAAINARTTPRFTFNHFDFSAKAMRAVDNRDLTEAQLVASTSLLMWSPPVRTSGSAPWLFDAVWCNDGNVGAAVSRGADEIWAIWTVSNTPELRSGFLAQYFHLIETVANAKFQSEWAEVAAVNASLLAGPAPPPRDGFDLRMIPAAAGAAPQTAPPGRKPITQHLIAQEVAMHYVLNLGADRAAAAVELGVADTRAYLRKVSWPVAQQAVAGAGPRPPTAFAFRETLRGAFMPGSDECAAGERAGRANAIDLTLRIVVETGDFDRFLHDPEHPATVRGFVDAPFLSYAPMAIVSGTFAPFVDDRDANGTIVPGRKRMVYTLRFTDGRGTTYRLEGVKRMTDDRGRNPWIDLTTLYVHLSVESGSAADPFGAGIVHVRPLDLLANLPTFTAGPDASPAERTTRIRRYCTFFAGRTWDVYLRGILDYAPF